MRVNGVRLRIKRVAGVLTLLLGVSFAGGYFTAKLTTEPTPTDSLPELAPQIPPDNNVQKLVAEEKKSQLAARQSRFKVLKVCNLPPPISKLTYKEQIERIEASHKYLSKEIDASEDLLDSLLRRGRIYLNLTLYERARKDFGRAISLKDDSFKAYLGRAKAFRGLGDFEAAEGDVTEAIDLDASQASAYWERGRLYREHGKFSDARKDFEVARVRDSEAMYILKDLALICEEMNDLESAKKHYLELKASNDKALAPFAFFALRRLATLSSIPHEEGPHPTVPNNAKPGLFLAQARFHLNHGHLGLAKSDLTFALVRLRKQAKLRLHFQAWRQFETGFSTRSERQYKDALTLFLIVRSKLGEAPANLAVVLKELQNTFPSSMEAALAHSYVSGAKLSRENYQGRLETGESWTEEAFQHAKAAVRQAHIFEQVGKVSMSKKCVALHRQLYFNPWHYQARFERAKNCALENHELDRVRSDLQRVLKVAPEHWRARFLLGQSLLKVGSETALQKASSQFGSIIEQLVQSTKTVDIKNRAFHRAEAHFERSQVSQAQLDKCLLLSSPRSALEDLSIAIDLVPRETSKGLRCLIKYYEARAKIHSDLGHLELATKDLTAAQLRRNEAIEESLVHWKLALKAREKHEHSAAIEEFNTALDYHQGNAQIIYDRGISKLKFGHFMPGILDLVKAIELDHKFGESFYHKATNVRYVVDFKRIVDEILYYKTEHPDDAHVAFITGYFYLVWTLYPSSDPGAPLEAENHLSRAIQLNPKFVSAYIHRSRALQKQNKLEEALRDIERALTLAPDAWNAYFYKSLVLSSTVPQTSSETKRKEVIQKAKALLVKTVKENPAFIYRMWREKTFKHLFKGESERNAFYKKYQQKD